MSLNVLFTDYITGFLERPVTRIGTDNGNQTDLPHSP